MKDVVIFNNKNLLNRSGINYFMGQLFIIILLHLPP